jgi:uncharacterized protein with FMN-binding domain
MRSFARAAALGASVTAIFIAAVAAPGAAPPHSITKKRDAASSVHTVAYLQRYRDGRSTGPVYDAYYGVVQVQAVIRDGRVVAVNVLRYPFHSGTSRSINRRALPRLEHEVITAQSADVHAVSGATLTSDAFIRSLSGALRQAQTNS